MGVLILNKIESSLKAKSKIVIGKINEKIERKKKNYVKLITISEDKPDTDKPLEYHAHTTEIPISELPREAKHISGHKGYYCLVDFDPEYISYRQAEIITDEDGEERLNEYNQMTAIDYWAYSRDNRIDKGFQAVGTLSSSNVAAIDTKKLITIGIVALVVIYFVTHMS